MHIPRSARLVALACAAVALGSQHPSAAGTDVILRAADARVVGTAWTVVSDASAAGGSRIGVPDAGAAKVAGALAAPASYIELTFDAEGNTPYHLWLRGKAHGNTFANDSVYVQFSDSVTSGGVATWQIGSTTAATVTLEDCTNCGVSGWGWQDNAFGTGVAAPPVYFATSGTHTIRLQLREDGFFIDQIVLSPSTYYTAAPGALKNDTTILTGGAPPPQPPAAAISRGPYLQQITTSSAVVVWTTRQPGTAWARVGTQDVSASSTFYPASLTAIGYDYYQHEARVTGLAPETTYAYQLFMGAAAATNGSDRLTTAPLPTTPITFIAFGDSGTGSAEQHALASVMQQSTFDFAMHVGDIVYGLPNGTGDATYTTYQKYLFEPYAPWLRRRPFVPITGNHDSRPSNGNGKAYVNVFVLPEDGGAGPYPDHAERYYSFDYGPVHFIALDTEFAFQDPSRRAAQLAWLEADLAATRQPWKIAFYHRSPFSSGGEHGSELPVRQAFAPLFERYGVQLAFSGHEHNYQRTVPWKTSSSSSQAVTYVVAGGGGAPLYRSGLDAFTAFAVSRHQFLRVTVTPCVARMESVGTTGAILDTWSLDRCAQETDAAPPMVAFANPAAGSTVSGEVPVGADASDDVRVEKVDLWVDGVLVGIDRTAPYSVTWNTASAAPGTHTLELRAYDIGGRRSTTSQVVTVAGSTATGDDIVIHAVQIPALTGNWQFVADSSAADGVRVWNPNGGVKWPVSASPASYFDVTFEAEAGRPYHLWLRMKADRNDYNNDSVSVQFSDAVTAARAPVYRIGGTTAASVILEDAANAGLRGWGWNDNGFGSLGVDIYFARSGTQTLRVQAREDGVSIDQIVLSPTTFRTRPPGLLKDDTTIVPSQ